MKRSDLHPIVRDQFEHYFEHAHDEEEEGAAPGAPPCDSPEECFVKIGHERMVELLEEFLADEPYWLRQLGGDREQP